MKLYDSTLAPNPRRVRIFMAEKTVHCETIQIDIMKGENLADAFLAVNSRGLLPTLVLDDGTVLDESVAICRYFEETHPEPPLMGTDSISKARIEARQRHMEFDGLLSASEAFRNSYPGFAARGIGGNVGQIDAIPALAERGKARVAQFYDRLNDDLSKFTYIAGSDFSIADITALCTVDFAKGGARVPIPDDYENLLRWHKNVSSRASAQA
jgi:glutathione S-transferase